uniref:Uncharacterized protein n=1 Tax=Steinernema glaseri TaxID=37863 RepID=A0A1I8AG31_9BILA
MQLLEELTSQSDRAGTQDSSFHQIMKVEIVSLTSNANELLGNSGKSFFGPPSQFSEGLVNATKSPP